MKITDPKAIAIIRKLDDSVLNENIENYPDEERDGRSDLDFLADEISYLVSFYLDDDHQWNYDLQEAKEIVSRTRKGTVVPVDMDLHPVYRESKIKWAIRYVAQYNAIRRAYAGLKRSGHYGMWA